MPYGSCEIDYDSQLIEIKEKPRYQHVVNTGLYVLDPSVFSRLTGNVKIDMDEFIKSLLADNMRVGVFPVSEDAWYDIGQWSEYNDAIKAFGASNSSDR